MAHIPAKIEQQMVMTICQTTSHVHFDGGDLKLIYLGNYTMCISIGMKNLGYKWVSEREREGK